MSSHAKLSPSSAHRWMACPGSVVLEDGIPEKRSVYADEGTCAHFLAEQSLRFEVPAAKSIGQRICIWVEEDTEEDVTCWEADVPEDADVVYHTIVDEDMAAFIQQYIDRVLEYAADDELLIEQRLDISPLTEEDDAKGTADAVVLLDDELQVHDLKYGRGKEVDAENNPQLLMYAAAAYEVYGPIADFQRIRVVIHQPRRGHLSEWDCTVEQLANFAIGVNMAADSVRSAFEVKDDMAELEAGFLDPGVEQCQWCKAKATCPALLKNVSETTGADFEDLNQTEFTPVVDGEISLEDRYAKVELVEGWCAAVRKAMHEKAERGESDQYKLVAGRRGNRTWGSNEATAEELLKKMRFKKEEMYSFKLLSPAQVEKLLKESPRRWTKLEKLIQQPDGKPQLAPMEDPRPSITVSADEFSNLEKDDG